MSEPINYHPNIYAMSIISSIAERVNSNKVSTDLKGVISDKIHFEDFCYNYKNYCLEETIQLSKNFKKGKRILKKEVVEQIDGFFNLIAGDSCMLFFSGHGEENRGDFILETGNKEGEQTNPADGFLSLELILERWQTRKCKQDNHLLLILDFCHSGHWVKRMERKYKDPKSVDVSIQASCLSNETSIDQTGYGGIFINNFLHVNGYRDIKFSEEYMYKNQESGKAVLRQTPVAFGDHKQIWDIYNLKANFNKWEQFAADKRPNPKGVFVFDNGDVFSGDFKSVQLNGEGTKKFRNGTRVKGNFVNDKLEGRGEISMSNGFTCSGEFKADLIYGEYKACLSNGETCVTGKSYQKDLKLNKVNFYLKDRNLYEGTFKDGNYDGHGKLCFGNGQVYEGDWVKDQKTGYGVTTVYEKNPENEKWFKSEFEKVCNQFFENDLQFLLDRFSKETFRSKFSGEYRKNYKHGKGVQEYASGDIFVGNYFKNQRKGPGVYFFTGNGFYDGTFENDSRHGEGTLYKDEVMYKGKFQKNKKHGKGLIVYKDGSQYDGEFFEDQKSGEGVLLEKDGSNYSGEFLKNGKFGEGKLAYANGNQFNGEFKADAEFAGEFISTNGRGYSGIWKKGVEYELANDCNGSAKVDQSLKAKPVASSATVAPNIDNPVPFKTEIKIKVGTLVPSKKGKEVVNEQILLPWQKKGHRHGSVQVKINGEIIESVVYFMDEMIC